MPYHFRPSVVVAQTGSGRKAVFLTEAGRWTSELEEAELIEDEAHGDIRLLDAMHAGSGVNAVRLAEVQMGPRGLVGLREAVA